MPTAAFRQLKQAAAVGAMLTAFALSTGQANAASPRNISWWSLGGFSAAADNQEQPMRPPEHKSVPAPADNMTLGAAAPAPMGYLRFCARRPDQCGLDGDASATFAQESEDDRASDLMAKYYWPIAFTGADTPDLRLTPTSGQSADAAPAAEPSSGRYDWSAIFGPPDKGTAGPSAQPEAAPQTMAATSTPVASSPVSAPAAVVVATNVASAPSDWPTVVIDGAALVSDPAAITRLIDPAATEPVFVSTASQGDAQPMLIDTVWQPERPLLAPAAEAPFASAPATGGAFLSWSSKPDGQTGAPAVAEQVVVNAATLAPTASVSDTPVAVVLEPARSLQPVATDRAAMALLDRVNLQVNRAIRFVPDQVQFGVNDYWTLPLEAGASAAGECKDYVLEKRRALIAEGIPAGDLSIAIVKTTWGEAHAVLLVATDRGELVMDSLSSQIRPWRKVPYQWIERQAPGQQLNWVKVLTGRSFS